MNEDYNNLIYLNKKRIELKSSKEYFWGAKLLKYLKLLKKFRFIKITKELFHDIDAFFRKNVSNHKIIDFRLDSKKCFEKKVVVYTCIYGNYDDILEPLTIDSNCEYYIFTDQKIKEGSIWRIADDSLIPDYCDTPAKKNRYVKMFPYLFFPESEYSIYLDGNLQLVGHPSVMVQNSIDRCKTGIEMHLAPREHCIYDEAKNLYKVGKITKAESKYILQEYRKNNMPHGFGMCECNVIVRKHTNESCKQIMEMWWDMYSNGVKRDQLYFTYVLFRLGYSFDDVVNFGASVNQNLLFLRDSHK